MRAFSHLGLETAAVAARGVPIRSLLLLDRVGRPMLEYAPSLSGGPDPIWVPLEAVREIIANTMGAAAVRPCQVIVAAGESPAGWTGTACPGILLRRLHGQLARPGTHLVWDAPDAHVGLTQLAEDMVFCYAVPRAVASKDEEFLVCRETLDGLSERLAGHIVRLGNPVQDEWFPLDGVGYRSCRGADALRWGPGALRLHPLTGQHLSYWAIQSVRLAEEVARNGGPSAGFLDRLDRDARTVYQRHLRSMAFYLRPTLFWRALFHPYALALRHSAFLRQRTVARVALLDLR